MAKSARGLTAPSSQIQFENGLKGEEEKYDFKEGNDNCICSDFGKVDDDSSSNGDCIIQWGGQKSNGYWERNKINMFKLDAGGRRLSNQLKSFGSFPVKIKRKYKNKTFKKKKVYGAGIVVYKNEIFVSGGSVEEDDHALTTIWKLSSRSGQWKAVGDMYTARRDHIMALDPFNSNGLIMCGGYSYRHRHWRFHIEWINEKPTKNRADVRCEGHTFMSIAGRTYTKAHLYGHKIKYSGGDKASFDRAQVRVEFWLLW